MGYHPIEGAEDFWLATDAYIYGYPLVTVEMTRRVATNVASVESTRGPMGQLINFRQYPDASYHDVTAPNADTLYSSAFFDVGKEPWVLSHPDMGNRYFLLPMLDGWTEVFAVPGSRTTGEGAQNYAITGPGWSGSLPSGVVHFPKGELPPVNGFWSITMYDPQFFFVANPISRYSISPRQNLKSNPDGSIDLYIQNKSPGADKESNWLPAPVGKFQLMLRMYWPKENDPSILNGTREPLKVQHTEEGSGGRALRHVRSDSNGGNALNVSKCICHNF
jgi:hypothetical protein